MRLARVFSISRMCPVDVLKCIILSMRPFREASFAELCFFTLDYQRRLLESSDVMALSPLDFLRKEFSQFFFFFSLLLFRHVGPK